MTLDKPVAWLEEFAEEDLTFRFMAHYPLYQALATYLNGHGGKDPKAKKLPRSQTYAAEELMPDFLLPPDLRPFRLTQAEARAILDALPHLKGANWAFQALINRVVSLADIERAAGAGA